MVSTHSSPVSAQEISVRSPWWRAALPAAIAIFLTFVTVWPLIDNIFVVSDRMWIPSGDWAVEGLRAFDFGANTPLLGPYSRFGWNHPGPLLFAVLALPLRAVNNNPNGLLIAALVVNALSVIGCAAIAWRRGRLLLTAITLAIMSLLLLSLGSAFLQDPWNPYITVLPFAFFAFSFWAIIDGDWKLWPFALFSGSFIVQSHLGYAPFLIAMALVGAYFAKYRHVAMAPQSRRNRQVFFGINAIVLALCWLPVVIDLLFVSHNAQNIISYFFSNDDSSAGLMRGLEIAAGQLRLHDAPWLGFRETAESNGAITGGNLFNLLIVAAIWMVAFWLTQRFSLRTAKKLLVITAVFIGVGILATAQITGPVFSYLVRWWWAIASIFWVGVVCALVQSAVKAFFDNTNAESTPRRDVQLISFQTVVIALCFFILWTASGRLTATNFSAPSPDSSSTQILSEFLDPTVRAMDGLGPVLVVSTGSVWGNYADAIRFALERNGTPVAAFPDTGYRFGDFRAERQAKSILWVVNADAANEWKTATRLCQLGFWDPLTPAQRAEFFAAQTEVIAQFNAAGRSDLAIALKTGDGGLAERAAQVDGVDLQLLARVEADNRKGLPVATYTDNAEACRRSLTN